MVDLHSHILWGLDDGAKSLEESIAMVRAAAAGGTTDIVATPHSNHQYRFDAALVRERAEELRAAVGETPRIYTGSDFHLSLENLDLAREDPTRFTINQRSYLLVEFADQAIPTGSGRIFDELQQRGIRPVITHPERNPILRGGGALLDQFLEQGCAVQITGQSLEGRFGRSAEKAAWDMIASGKVHAVASDAHDLDRRPASLEAAFRAVAEQFGHAIAERIFLHFPKLILTGEPLPRRTSGGRTSKISRWFPFLGRK